MKKLLITLILLSTYSFSGEVEIAAKIIDKISTELTKKERVSVYTTDIRNLYIIKISKHLNREKACTSADLVLTKDETLPMCGDKTLFFATDYLAFKKNSQAVGAFFYQKGRPSIVFRKEQLNKHNIVLSKEFEKYID